MHVHNRIIYHSIGKYIKRSHYIHLRDLHSQLRNVSIVIAAVNSKYIYMQCNIFNIERLSVLNHICKSNHPQHHRQDNSMPSEDESMWGSKQEKQLRMRTNEETWESRSEGNNVQWGATGESTKTWSKVTEHMLNPHFSDFKISVSTKIFTAAKSVVYSLRNSTMEIVNNTFKYYHSNGEIWTTHTYL